MKLRFSLRHLNNYNESKILTSDLQFSSRTNTEKIIDYQPLSINNTRILHLKLFISNYLKQQSDSITLWQKDNIKTNQIIELNDIDSITKLFLSTNSISTIDDDMSYNHAQNQLTHGNASFIIIIYYKITTKSIRINVDFNQKNIEKIKFKLSSSCSIILLKHKIEDQLNKNNNLIQMPYTQQRLFGISITNITKLIIYKMVVNKEYDDRMKLYDILDILKNQEHKDKDNSNTNDIIIINLLLVFDTKKTMKMGLNFSFNYFKNLSYVNFDESAPCYRECSDGLNMIIYCLNKNCMIYNQMFIMKIGYGCFNIITESKRARCPCCFCSSMLEARNVGMINSKWDYVGIMINKISRFEGDGMTLENNKLFLLAEVKIVSAFNKLSINITPHKNSSKDITIQGKTIIKAKVDNKMKPISNSDINSYDDENDIRLFDSIPLCINEKENDNPCYDNNNDNNNNNSSIMKDDLNEKSSLNEINLARKIQQPNKQLITNLDNKGDHCLNSCLLKSNLKTDSLCVIY